MVVLEENINARVKCHTGFSGFTELKGCVYEYDTLTERFFLVVLQKETMVPLSPLPPSGFRQNCLTT